MKLEINTETKQIKVIGNANLNDIVTWMKEKFKDWKEYEILQSVEYIYNNQPSYPVWPITYLGTGGTYPATEPLGWEVTCITN